MLEYMDVSKCPAQPRRIRVATTVTPSWVTKGDPEVSTVNMYGSSPDPQTLIKERIIPAGHVMVYIATAMKAAAPGAPGYTCENAGMFVPQPEHQYEIDYQTHAGAPFTAPSCRIGVFELKRADSGFIQRVPVSSSLGGAASEARSDACLLVP
jgi:hypothetical protein